MKLLKHTLRHIEEVVIDPRGDIRTRFNALARHIGAKVIVVDCGVALHFEAKKCLKIKKVGLGTRNMSEGPAMSREDAVRSIEAGIELIEEEMEEGLGIVGSGD